MKRKIIGNLLVGLILPILILGRWLPNTYHAVFFDVYEYYDFHITSLSQFLSTVYRHYIFIYVISLLFILLPFQVLKDLYYAKKGKYLSLLKKVLFLVLLLLIENMLFIRGPIYEWYGRYILFAAGIGIPISILLYFTVDRYVERK